MQHAMTAAPDIEAATGARIQLADGAMFAPLMPDPDSLTPDAIAIGLSRNCRFAGQLRAFHSVAQHSVLVAGLCPPDIDIQRFALLHDAEEAFGLPDLATPLKPFFPAFVAAQARIGAAVFRRYGVDPSLKAVVKPFDLLALAIEKRDLKESRPGYLEDLPDPPSWIRLQPLGPRAAERLFRAAWRRLFDQSRPIDRAWLLSRAGFRAPD